MELKKLSLKKETIANLSGYEQNHFQGGRRTGGEDDCGGDDTNGTGYGMCICNPTALCCYGSNVDSCSGVNSHNHDSVFLVCCAK